jgi:hypothetical protein
MAGTGSCVPHAMRASLAVVLVVAVGVIVVRLALPDEQRESAFLLGLAALAVASLPLAALRPSRTRLELGQGYLLVERDGQQRVFMLADLLRVTVAPACVEVVFRNGTARIGEEMACWQAWAGAVAMATTAPALTESRSRLRTEPWSGPPLACRLAPLGRELYRRGWLLLLTTMAVSACAVAPVLRGPGGGPLLMGFTLCGAAMLAPRLWQAVAFQGVVVASTTGLTVERRGRPRLHVAWADLLAVVPAPAYVTLATASEVAHLDKADPAHAAIAVAAEVAVAPIRALLAEAAEAGF